MFRDVKYLELVGLSTINHDLGIISQDITQYHHDLSQNSHDLSQENHEDPEQLVLSLDIKKCKDLSPVQQYFPSVKKLNIEIQMNPTIGHDSSINTNFLLWFNMHYSTNNFFHDPY